MGVDTKWLAKQQETQMDNPCLEILYEQRIKILETKLNHAELHLRRLTYLQSGGVITGTQSERWLQQALDFLAALVGVNNDKGGEDG